MITIASLPKSDIMAPVVICDHCGERIEDAKGGNYEYVWHWPTKRVLQAAQLHKACSTPYRHSHPADVPDAHWMWTQLDEWLKHLAFNLHHPFPATDEDDAPQMG